MLLQSEFDQLLLSIVDLWSSDVLSCYYVLEIFWELSKSAIFVNTVLIGDINDILQSAYNTIMSSVDIIAADEQRSNPIIDTTNDEQHSNKPDSTERDAKREMWKSQLAEFKEAFSLFGKLCLF